MDDADPFVKRMLARNEARRAMLARVGTESPAAKNDKENISCPSAEVAGKASKEIVQSEVPVLQDHQSNVAAAPNVPPVPPPAPLYNSSTSTYTNPSKSVPTPPSKAHSPTPTKKPTVRSPVRTAASPSDSETPSPGRGRSRFGALARRQQQMQQWEDDYAYHSTGSRSPKEAQGFTPTESQSRLVYEFNKEQQEDASQSRASPVKPSPQKKSNTRDAPDGSSEEQPPPKVLSCVLKTTTTKTSKETVTEVKRTTTTTEDQCVPTTETVRVSGRSQSPSKVSNLRDRWEQQIREQSPERQAARSVSPSKTSHGRIIPIQREDNNIHRPRSPTKSSSTTVLSNQHRSRSPLKSSHLTSVVTNSNTPAPSNSAKSTSALMASSNAKNNAPSASYSPVKSSSALHSFNVTKAGSSARSGQPEVVKGVCPMPPTAPVLPDEYRSSVKARAAAFTAVMDTPETPQLKDPTELSLQGRRQLFEKQGGEAILPKVPFGQPVPARLLTTNTSKFPVATSSGVPTPRKYVQQPLSGHASNLVSDRRAALEASAAQPVTEDPWQVQRQQELNALQNRFSKAPQESTNQDDQSEVNDASDSEYPESEYSHHALEASPDAPLSPGPPKPPRTFASPEKTVSFEPHVKPGCLYPGLSDIDSQSEADMDESTMTTTSMESLGTKIHRMAQGQRPPELNTVMEVHEAAGIEDALDEAFDDEDDSHKDTPPKRYRDEDEELVETQSSYKKTPRVAPSPLQHTISMYRKQKPAELNYTPVRKVVIRPEPQQDTPPSSVVRGTASPSVAANARRIAELAEQEASELRIISQASVAVSVAEQRNDQFGTSHHIEAEKLLLLSTHRRQAILNEIHRLKTNAAVGTANWTDESSFGNLSINEISLPLSQDFLTRGVSMGCQHIVLLTKYREQVIASSVLSTPASISNACLTFPSSLNLQNLTPDFVISLEIYALKVAPLSSSSGSHKKDSRMKLTPLKRLQHHHSKHHSPVVSSPGGPSAIRAPSFTLIGCTQLTIASLNRTIWSLDRVPVASPLNGEVVMKVQCNMQASVSERSFLTVFQDVGGLGAWSRRWAVLSGDTLKFWTYPDQENKKECNQSVSLKQVITRKVEQVSRDVCARPNTFLLTTERPTVASDTNSLTTDITSSCTVTKWLLSADSIEEKQEWCRKLSIALANIRAWCPDANRPHDYNV